MNSPILEMKAENSILTDTFVLTPTGLQINGTPSFDEWMAYGQTLWAMRSAIQWAIADWIRYGEGAYADRYAQAVDETRMSNQTLQNYVWVAGKFEPSRRRGNLSFSHHEAVASIPDPEIQDELLQRATAEKMSREDIRAAAKPHKPTRPARIQRAGPGKSASKTADFAENGLEVGPDMKPTQTNVPILSGHALVFGVSGEKATLRIDNPALLDALREAQRCDYPVYVMIQRTSKRPQFSETIDAMARFGRTSTRLSIAKEA